MHKKLTMLLALLCALAFTAATAAAQVTGGAVTGVVSDAQGALVPGAAVTLRSKETGQTLTSQTTDSGSYTFPNVPVGTYTISIEKSGFQTATQELSVSLNQTTTVNATLQVAGVTAETVTVTAASEALVQTDSSQLGKTYEAELVRNLPIFGNQNTLAALSPNVVLQAAGSAGSGGAVGGVRPRYNSFMIDGVDNNQFSVTGPQTTVIQDAVAEFTLLTNNFNAEFGSGSGGQFNTITKSGTNEYNGNLFGYLQNQHFNAASTAQERARLPFLPRFRNTRYGVTLGGPVVKNKLFFFGAYQHENNGRSVAGSSFLAPTEAGLNQIATLPGASPFVVNLIRGNLVLAPTATTTQTILGASVPFGTVAVSNPGGFNDYQTQLNFDHLRGTKDQFRYRFSSDKNDQEQATGLGNAKFNNNLLFRSYLFSSTWVRTFSSSVINDLRLSYRRHRQDFTLKEEAFNTFANLTVRAINLGIGPQSNLPQGQFSNNYQVYDTINYIRGSHSIKFGGEYRNLIATSQFLPRGRGDYIYVNFEDLVRDVVPTFDPVRGVGSGAFTFNQEKYYVFAQDDWKVTPNLTVNLGLRYEYNTLPRDAALQALNAISNQPGFITFGVPKTDKNNFAPRIGFAYSPEFDGGWGGWLFGSGRGKSSIRANFAMTYGEIFGNLTLLTLPPQFQQELRPANVPGFNTSPGFLQRGGLPSVPNPPTTVAAARAASGSYTSDFIQPETYSWALSFQRELTPTMALELRYLGTRSRHLPIQLWLNPGIPPTNFVVPTFFSQPTAAQLAGLQPVSTLIAARRFANPAFGILTTFDPIGNSQYDGAAANVTRRFSDGLAFTASYTFSKTISNSDNEVFSSVANPRRAQNNLNIADQRALSDLDIPHRFVIGLSYEPQWFKESGNWFQKKVLANWTISSIWQMQSGQPFTPQSGVDSNLNFDAAGDRTIFNPAGAHGTGTPVCAVNSAGQFLTSANAVTTDINSCRPGGGAAVAYFAINPNAQYVQAGLGARANAGRNTLRSNRVNRTDAAFMKRFPFGDNGEYNVEIGAEVNNLFNQRIFAIGNFGNALGTATAPGLSPTDTAFPTVSSALFNQYSIGNFPGRTIQFRGKINF